MITAECKNSKAFCVKRYFIFHFIRIFQRKLYFYHQREYLFRFFNMSFCIVALTAWIFEHFWASTIVCDETVDCFSAAINDLSCRKQWLVTSSDSIILTILTLFHQSWINWRIIFWNRGVWKRMQMNVIQYCVNYRVFLLVKTW